LIVPGRIVVIDNKLEDVRLLLDELNKQGEFVSFLDPVELEAVERFAPNCRLLITDYFIVENDQDNSLASLTFILKELSETARFFGLIVWTGHPEIIGEIEQSIKDAYYEESGSALEVPFLAVYPKQVSYDQIIGKISGFIQEKPELGLMYIAEGAVHAAHDRLINELLPEGIIGDIIRGVHEEFGTGTARQILDLFVRMISRKLQPQPELKRTIERIVGLKASKVSGYPKIHALQSYYAVSEDEPLWTGDIVKFSGQFYVVISPACDFAQKKVERITLAKAVFVPEESLRVGNERVQTLLTESGYQVSQDQLCKRILRGTISERHFVLHFVPYEGQYYHAILDFQTVTSYAETSYSETADSLQKGRILRVDHPYIDELLHRYSAYSSRIGIPSIPENVAQSLSSMAD
jgi:hypothetical protein